MKFKLDKKTVRDIYGIILSLLLSAVGICFIVSCILIYSEGESPFSRERVAKAISSIALPIWLLIGALICAIPVHVICPSERERLKPYRMTEEHLATLTERLGDRPKESDVALAVQERKFRFYVRLGAVGIALLMLIYPIIYLFVPSNFTLESMNDDVAHAILSFLPSILVSLGAFVACSHLCAHSVEREIDALKALVKAKPSLFRAKKREYGSKNEEKWVVPLRIATLLIAVTFIVIGIFNGGMKDVLSKAIKLCTECVGLG